MTKRMYVAYGSNLNVRQMAVRCPTAKLVATGVIDGYELQFKGGNGSAVATIAEKSGSFVPVAVWDIRPDDERSLDIYEGYPHLYQKENTPVKIKSGDEITAMIYVMDPKYPFGVPSFGYCETIREGYEDYGLDVNILSEAVTNSVSLYNEKVRDASGLVTETDGEIYGSGDEAQELFGNGIDDEDDEHYFDLREPRL